MPTAPIEELAPLGVHLAAIEKILTPTLIAVLGMGLTQELTYAIAAYRQRYPDYWPGGQQRLL